MYAHTHIGTHKLSNHPGNNNQGHASLHPLWGRGPGQVMQQLRKETSAVSLFLWSRNVKAKITPSHQTGIITFEGNIEQGQSTSDWKHLQEICLRI